MRHLDWILSALMWLLFLYFLREAIVDLYHLAGDSFTWAFAEGELPELLNFLRFFDSVHMYFFLILANGVIFLGWARYNQARFGIRKRRNDQKPVSIADLALHYNLPAEDITNWQQSRILVMTHTADGTLDEVTSKGLYQIPMTSE